MQKYILKII